MTQYLVDTFSGTNTSHWSAPDSGPTWTEVGTGFSEGGGKGNINFTATNSTKSARGSDSTGFPVDMEITCLGIGCDRTVTGAAISSRMCLRQQDANNAYLISLILGSTGAVSLAFGTLIGGTVTTIHTFTLTGVTHTAGDSYNLIAQVRGTNPTLLRGKLWKTTDSEPGFWQWEERDSTAILQQAGTVGVRCNVASGYTGSLPLVWSYDSFTAQDRTDNFPPAYRGFTDDSFWNSTVADETVSIDSAELLDYLANVANQNDYVRISGVQTTPEWGLPFYWPVPGDPVHDVTTREFAVPTEFKTMRIPLGAEPSPNSDSVMVVVDINKGIMYDLHGVEYSPGPNTYTVDSGGVYYLDSNGLAFDVEGSDNIRNMGHRGVPNITGAIRWDEIQEGVIRHKIRAASHHNQNTWVYPMDGSDGTVGREEKWAPPEGMLLRLKQDIDLNSLSIAPFTRIVLKCFQDYGIFIGDGSGANFEVKVENTEAEGRGTLFEDIGVVNALLSAYDLPTYFEVIQFPPPITPTPIVYFAKINTIPLTEHNRQPFDIATGIGTSSVMLSTGERRILCSNNMDNKKEFTFSWTRIPSQGSSTVDYRASRDTLVKLSKIKEPLELVYVDSDGEKTYQVYMTSYVESLINRYQDNYLWDVSFVLTEV